MNKWKIKYFNESVRDEIKSLPKKLFARYFVLVDRMVIDGPDIGEPHTSSMGGGLFEIRVKALEGIARVFYCVNVGHEIWILHGFIKKTPPKELKIARERQKEILK